MRPPRHIEITTKGMNERGDLIVDVRLRRRTIGALRLFYKTLRDRGVGRVRSAVFSIRVALHPQATEES